jgi:serine protease Do
VSPVPAVPPAPPVPPGGRDRGPKVPVTYLGVETSGVPRVVSDQLGLPRGFGLVVDYVVPNGPAAAAGVQQNDILRLFNDQILMEPDQLAKLVRSYPEGTNVTLTVLRKGQETKLTATLAKREVSENSLRDRRWHRGPGLGNLEEQLENLGENLGDFQFGFSTDDVGREAREEARRATREASRLAREEGQRAREEARRARDEARRVSREARQAARELRVVRGENGTVRATTIDMGRAQIVFHDNDGELKIENVDGKKILTAKDAQGRLLFSGPVGTPEEVQKLPEGVKQRYEKLEQKDLPALAPGMNQEQREQPADSLLESDNEDNNDNDRGDTGVQEVRNLDGRSFPYRSISFNTVLI